MFDELKRKAPIEVPPHLRLIVPRSDSVIHDAIKNHAKFNDPQNWILDRKLNGKPGRCSGCIFKDIIRVCAIHFAVKGLFFDEAKNNQRWLQLIRTLLLYHLC